MSDPADELCQICGHDHFDHRNVLWPGLSQAWELSPDETAYVDVQQGTHCVRCGSNVRSQALARALLGVLGGAGPLAAFVDALDRASPRLLEINEAGTLTPWLSRLPGHVFARYPESDMMHLPYADRTFDIVVHSDTLEHVKHPDIGLRECRRVTRPGGACIFTVPVIVGRLTRSRRGLPPSFHGHPACTDPDCLVHTEFGADVWTYVLEAGFTACELVHFRYPAGLAIVAHRNRS